MGNIVIDRERCKGCELCVSFCPRHLIRLSEEFNSKGQHPAEFEESEECPGCAVCAMMCPDIAIEVYR